MDFGVFSTKKRPSMHPDTRNRVRNAFSIAVSHLRVIWKRSEPTSCSNPRRIEKIRLWPSQSTNNSGTYCRSSRARHGGSKAGKGLVTHASHPERTGIKLASDLRAQWTMGGKRNADKRPTHQLLEQHPFCQVKACVCRFGLASIAPTQMCFPEVSPRH